jgi:ComF family protein
VPDLLKIVTILPEIKGYLENSILVPVPLHKTRERKRGYNQSLLIAQAWAKGVPGARVEEVLIRHYSTQSQTELSRAERLKNVKNAFAIRPKVALNPALLYTVIDDVYTTGATLNACAKVLYRAGAERIQVVTLAHG